MLFALFGLALIGYAIIYTGLAALGTGTAPGILESLQPSFQGVDLRSGRSTQGARSTTTGTTPGLGTGSAGARNATPQLRRILGALAPVPGIKVGGVCATAGDGAHMDNSEHYHCNAGDVFGSELVLDALLRVLLAAAKARALPIHCLIYERQIYSRERRFAAAPYSGASTHDTHIHVSGWPSVGGAC